MMEEEEETLFDQEGLLGDRSSERSEKSEWKKKLSKTVALSFAFFSLGCCVAIPGATLLDLGERVGKDTEHMTFIATARSAGYLIGSVFGGILSDFFDHQLVMFYTLALTSIATAMIPWCTILFAMTCMVGVQGLALGVLDTGGNVFCIRIWGKKSPPYIQFLHLAFAIGAFIAPLIAHPFLLNSITEVSSNSSENNNSNKAALPYATSDNFSRSKRDVLHDYVVLYSKYNDNDQMLPSYLRHKREEVMTPGIVNSVNKNFTSNFSTVANDSSVHASRTPPQTVATTIRPKKPEIVNPPSEEHADSHLIIDKLKDLQKNPITSKDNDDKENEERKIPSTISTLAYNNMTNISNSESVNATGSVNNNSISEQSLEASATKDKTSVILSKQMSTSSSTTSTTTTAATLSSTSTAPSPMTPMKTPVSPKKIISPPTVGVPTGFDKSKADENSNNMMINSVLDLTTEINNSSNLKNNSTVNKPENTWADLVYTMLDTMRHMSKIQFAYLIIGLFLIVDAGIFLALYCKDKISGYKLTITSHEDLTRPPDTPCFIVSFLFLLFVFFMFYVGMEQTYGILLTTFAVEFKDTVWTPAQGAILTAIFWGCVALGRGISIGVSCLFKAPCMLVTNLILTLLGAILLSFALKSAWYVLWIGTVILGLGMSSLFPTTISWTDSYYPLTGKATAVFVAGCGVGQMSIPVLTGYLYQNVDHMCLMYMVLTLSILLCIIYTILQVIVSRRGGNRGISRSYSGFMRLDTSEDMADSLDMDLIQAGSMDRPLSLRDGENHRKENGVNGDYEESEFSKLVELSD